MKLNQRFNKTIFLVEISIELPALTLNRHKAQNESHPNESKVANFPIQKIAENSHFQWSLPQIVQKHHRIVESNHITRHQIDHLAIQSVDRIRFCEPQCLRKLQRETKMHQV